MEEKIEELLMKISISRRINFFDIDPDYRITIGSLFRVLQEASSKHSDAAENGMTAVGRRWIMHQVGAIIERYPKYGETVTAVTWHRGTKGYKAYRDYELYSDGERLAAATSVWLFYDLDSRRLLKVPADTGEKYGSENILATDIEINSWKPDTGFTPDYSTQITTRPTDYDPLQHVNNVVYFDYVTTLLCRNGMDPGKIKRITLQYQKEIGQDIDTVQAGFSLSGQTGSFKVFSGDVVFAAGDFNCRD